MFPLPYLSKNQLGCDSKQQNDECAHQTKYSRVVGQLHQYWITNWAKQTTALGPAKSVLRICSSEAQCQRT